MKRLLVASLWVEGVVLAALVCGLACDTEGRSHSSAPPGAAAVAGAAATPPPNAVPPSQVSAGAGGGAGGDATQHSSAGAPAQAAAGAGGAAGREAADPGSGASEDCEGFEVLGLKYSPGGHVLPNRCKPFHSLTNNPYAIRCIDAMPEFATKFPGDDSCILPPAPEQGFQVGVHPLKNAEYWEKMWAGDFSFYDDAAVTAPYEVAPGGETVQNYDAVLAGAIEGRFFYPQHSLELPPEEEGIGYPASSTGAFFNLHHFNATNQAVLRENWVNVWYIPGDQVTKEALYFVGQAPVNYPPGMVLDSHSSITATAETQVLSMVAHRHAWTTRLHAWVVRTGSTTQELVYDSYDWGDMPTYSYNSSITNPPPGNGTDGAASGPLVLHAGDVVHFNCHIDTTAARAAQLGVDAPSAPLRFGNQAFVAEMCLLNGHTTGARLGFGF
ncbi:MAG TPA: hypothetical protein VK524_09890 [Polyangiaceae bacterium]|nr:hypothetical protein [Polyangiaceae bacterium]